MSDLPSSLETPVLLIAMPQVLDPHFHKSVILLLHHEDEGSVGLIVNRPTEIRVQEILHGMEISWGGEPKLTAYFGGPVQPQLGSLLCAGFESESDESGLSEIVPGLAVSQSVTDLALLATDPPARFRLLLGYAGWGEGQLLEEIERNDWLLAPVSVELIFADEGEAMWESALASVGVDPAALPAMHPSPGGAAN